MLITVHVREREPTGILSDSLCHVDVGQSLKKKKAFKNVDERGFLCFI